MHTKAKVRCCIEPRITHETKECQVRGQLQLQNAESITHTHTHLAQLQLKAAIYTSANVNTYAAWVRFLLGLGL